MQMRHQLRTHSIRLMARGLLWPIVPTITFCRHSRRSTIAFAFVARMVFYSRFILLYRRFLANAAPVLQPPFAIMQIGRVWRLQLANPKTILFFIAFLPLFVDADKPAGSQMIVLAAASFVVEFFRFVCLCKNRNYFRTTNRPPDFAKHLHRSCRRFADSNHRRHDLCGQLIPSFPPPACEGGNDENVHIVDKWGIINARSETTNGGTTNEYD